MEVTVRRMKKESLRDEFKPRKVTKQKLFEDYLTTEALKLL